MSANFLRQLWDGCAAHAGEPIHANVAAVRDMWISGYTEDVIWLLNKASALNIEFLMCLNAHL